MNEVVMEQARFKVVFEKLTEATAGEAASLEPTALVCAELDEISELRRLAVELSEPEPQSYTLT
jgi:hypothetical protein